MFLTDLSKTNEGIVAITLMCVAVIIVICIMYMTWHMMCKRRRREQVIQIDAEPPPNSNSDSNDSNSDSESELEFGFTGITRGDCCPVCHEKFRIAHRAKGDTITVTDCSHTYHRECLVQWFRTKQQAADAISCPSCRHLPTQLEHYRNGVPFQVDSIVTQSSNRAIVTSRDAS